MTSEARSKAAKERWERMSEAERTAHRESLANSMREFWKGKTKEERLARAKKAAATRKANQVAKLKGKQ
jgi:hypothetical protein